MAMCGTSKRNFFLITDEPYNLPKNCLPTNNDVLRYYYSRNETGSNAHDTKLQQLAGIIESLWIEADCCPFSKKIIKINLKTLISNYKSFKQKTEKKSHHKVKSTVIKKPERRSLRNTEQLDNSIVSNEEQEIEDSGDKCNNINSKQYTRSLAKPNKEVLDKWNKEYGDKLFDVFSIARMKKDISEGYAFDSDFYEDQKDPNKRLKVMEIMKVTKEYYQQQRKIQKRQAISYQRRISQYYSNNEDSESVDLEDQTPIVLMSKRSLETQDSEYQPESKKCSISSPTAISIIQTKSHNRLSEAESYRKTSLMNVSTQTEKAVIPDLKTRAEDLRCTNPNILQAAVLMCAVGNQSASQAVLNLFIIGNEVFQQEWVLPLILQKKYQAKLQLAKKLRSTFPNDPNRVIDEVNNPDSEKLKKIEKYLKETKVKQKDNIDHVLPDPRTVRSAEEVAASFVEEKIAEKIMSSSSNCLMFDCTSRSKVGKMGAALVLTDGKARALKMQKMASETQDNLADTLIHQLKRTVEISPHSVEIIYAAINLLLSDSCGVNTGIGKVLSAKLGLTYKPGHLLCCIHSVLGFSNGIVEIWCIYQLDIGHNKMYPSISGFDPDMEDKSLIKQILECFLRLTSDRWQARSWNRYEEYCAFTIERGFPNLGRELHGNRFGEFERCCAIGVYSMSRWVEFIESYANLRNDLAAFLRDCLHLSEICTFLWLGAALIGVHLVEPYMTLILDMKATHSELLETLKNVYSSLNTYEIPFSQLEKPAIPALSKAWINPTSKQSPYGELIGLAMKEVLENTDLETLDGYLKQLCIKMGQILKRQRGNAYGFGDLKEDSEDLVTKQGVSQEMLDKVPTHTKKIENFFGNSMSVIDRFGPKSFNKAANDMVIKYSQDLLKNPSEWCNTDSRKKCKKQEKLQRKFDVAQKELGVSRIVKAEDSINQQNLKVQRAVQNCRVYVLYSCCKWGRIRHNFRKFI